ncbi:zinc ribbon domain-containing protein [Sporocytophaga myxococcoides]|uniref:zinc ribbon domain-containing protein n=1 Tax=Sporocytophaga myxococcoides TaxID=153721 RepID=UPI0004039D86|nr:C4-type zinc ribbon domain-containing protein [Sporocytophaga myxococcoides]
METTIAQKLEALVKLQTIDSKLEEIKKIRGDLPEEVRDLEDELEGYETRVGKYQSDIQNLNDEITKNKLAIKDAEKNIKKYEDQQKNVRNNREYDAITKEVELQQLEIQISEKRTKEYQHKINQKNDDIANTQRILDDRKKDLKQKKDELETLSSESKDEEVKLLKEREKASKSIEERLLNSYNKIRLNANNGLAVVSVKRDACGGCFNTVPPQRQVDIRDKKKLIVCEHCGRIFADVETVVLESAKK